MEVFNIQSSIIGLGLERHGPKKIDAGSRNGTGQGRIGWGKTNIIGGRDKPGEEE